MLIETWEQADEQLRKLGLSEMRMKQIEAQLTIDIARLKKDAASSAAVCKAHAAQIREELEDFWDANKPAGQKSWRGTFGKFGRRASRKVKFTRKVAQVIVALGMGYKAFLRCTYKPDKEEILKADAKTLESLRKCGVTVKESETFFAEPDREAVSRAS